MSLVNNARMGREIRISCLLGLAGLLVNSIFIIAGVLIPFELGNVFFFTSVGAFGLTGALTSLASGSIPLAIVTGDHWPTIRLLVVCCIAGYAIERSPKLSVFWPVSLSWIFLVGPSIYLLKIGGDLSPIHYALLRGLSDITLACLATSLLHNPDIWAKLTQTPKHWSLNRILSDSLTLIAVGVAFACLSITTISDETLRDNALISISLVAVFIPSIIALMLSERIVESSHGLLPDNLSPGHKRKTLFGFSGPILKKHKKNRQDLTVPEETSPLTTEQTLDPSDAPQNAERTAESEYAVCALDTKGTILYANGYFRDITDARLNSLIGKNVSEIGMNSQIGGAFEDFVNLSFSKGPRVSEIKLNELPQRLRFIQFASYFPAVTPSLNEQAPSASMIFSIKDVTEKRTIDSNLLAEQKLESIGVMTSGIGHAFSNILTGIAGEASCAQHSQDPNVVARCLSTILTTVKQAGLLVHQLIEYAAVHPASMKPEHLNAAIKERIGLLQKAAGEKYPVSFQDSSTDLHVSCDIGLVTQAVTNLILNAKEAYRDKAGSVYISLKKETIEEEIANTHPGTKAGQFARLRVRDQGCGMTADKLSLAFEPLLSKSPSSHHGTGLSSVYAIVRAHDGFLTAESKPEKGTTISLYLPLIPAPTDLHDKTSFHDGLESEVRAALFEKDQTAPKSILVVEDDENIRTVVSSMLSTLGYTVTSCPNGEAAIASCDTTPYDLALVDLVLPNIQGDDLIRAMKTNHPSLKGLLMTGYGIQITPSCHGIPVLPKPFDLETLARAVKRVISEDS